MKKLLLTTVLLTSILFVGCKNSEEDIDKNLNSNLNTSVTQNENINDEGNRICSDDNKPSLIQQKGYQSLNKCGEETDYIAYKIEEANQIVFVTFSWAEPTESYSIKTIQTTSPYTETTLATLKNALNSFFFNNCQYSDDLFYCTQFGDGPGHGAFVFTLNPETNDFIFVENRVQKEKVMQFASSFTNDTTYYEYALECDVPFCNVINSTPTKITYNDSTYELETIESGDIDDIIEYAQCDYFDYSEIFPNGENISITTQTQYQNPESFTSDNFPPKSINCYNNEGMIGTFNFAENNFNMQ
ncbi:hypothetical protein GF366_00630 [Candidatus Peregrinibacteria bacterium]|nr:hypothetical protein [Candidatus Peregrinibacteria bacterium]